MADLPWQSAAALLLKSDASGARSKGVELIQDWPSGPDSLFVLSEAEAASGNAGAAAEARRKSGIEWVGGVMELKLA